MSLIFYLLLCLSLHACSARHLGIIDKETVTGLKPQPQNMKPSVADKLRVQKQLRIEIDRRTIIRNWDGANLVQEKISDTSAKENDGCDVILPSREEVLDKTSDLEERKRQARSLMESSPAEETVNSKENDLGEDIVVMDYAQPHRKPPIHNKEP